MKSRTLLLALTLCAIPCAASADDADSAREHFNRGVALLDDSQFAGAVAELEKSRAIRETAPVLFNLGLACRGVGRYLDALDHFRRFLAIRDVSKHEKMAGTARTLIDELQAALVHVEVRVSGGATSVRVDGKQVAQRDGAHAAVLDPGKHVFEAVREGYEPAVQSIDLKAAAREQVTLDAGARPKPSRIAVDATPAQAEIWLDGKLVGRGRYQGLIAVGTRRLRVVAAGHVPADRTLRVNPDSRQQISIALTQSSRPITKQWWFWAGGAAVVAGSVLAAVLLRPDKPTPYEGSLGFVSEALR